MKTLLLIFWLSLLFSDRPDPLRFQEEISEFKESDKMDPPPQGSYVFIGSSSMRMWKTLKDDFKGYPVLNRGFGGSLFSDAIYYFNDIVKPYNPRKIIIYEGDNDLASNMTPEAVFNDFKTFIKLILKNIDKPEIAVIGPKPSPQRWHLKEQYESLNSKIEKYCDNHKNMTYIDVYNHMLNDNGKPYPEIFLSDSLHMNEKGYTIWKELVQPFIEK